MSTSVNELVDILRVRPNGVDRFVGISPPGVLGRIFGGQFLGQAVMAANATIDNDKLPHSLHASFLRAGSPGEPVDYRVERIRDGRSFATRRVVGSQNGTDRFEAMVSCCAPEGGLDFHQPGPLATGAFDTGASIGELVTYGEWLASTTADPEAHYETQSGPRPIEVRYANPPANPPQGPTTEPQRMWYRIPGILPEDPVIHLAALAYLSDETLIDNAMLPHGLRWSDDRLQGASLDHALWLLRPVRADQWLLFDQTVVSTAAARGLVRGELYAQDGTLVAVATQEGLLRWSDHL